MVVDSRSAVASALVIRKDSTARAGRLARCLALFFGFRSPTRVFDRTLGRFWAEGCRGPVSGAAACSSLIAMDGAGRHGRGSGMWGVKALASETAWQFGRG